jgi:hypothetical protein
MLWAMFGGILVLTLLSLAADVEATSKYDGDGVGMRTLGLATLWVVLGIARELISAIDPLL